MEVSSLVERRMRIEMMWSLLGSPCYLMMVERSINGCENDATT